MAKVPLRAYNREIETMIDRGQLDEAIAHCHHIFKTFPKHLETYRLLGKAYLEYKRYKEAVDIFSRVLVSAPNDFVANVGMSIIRDEENKLDDAIWHMERAFEVQPSNAAIQSELQRLYGRRDGVQPPRIRMTRGALAHMYVQGELYPQAISEIKSVLKEDPGRSDMEALLARACYRSGLKNEAADAASRVLRRYPYCLDANRVLMEIFSTDKPENAQVYRQRVVELDPYAAHVTGTVFQSNEVLDAAVTIEHLDWNGQPVGAGTQADWSANQAIRLEGGPNREEQPEWLRNAYADTTPPTSPSPTRPIDQATGGPVPAFDTSPKPSSEDEIPDFLRAAGWGQSTGAFDESKPIFGTDEPAPAQPIEQGEIPDWVKAMAPTEVTQLPPPEDEELPDWINKIGSGSLPVPSATDSEQVDWMSQLGQASEPASSEQATSGDLDWLSQLGQPSQPSPAEGSTDDQLDWIKELDSTASSMVAPTSDDVPEWMRQPDQPIQAEQSVDDQPDWIKQIEQPESSMPASTSEETPEWMDRSEQPAQAAPVEQASDDLPDWMKQFDQPVTSSASEDQPEWMKQPEEAASSLPASEEQPDWMRPLDLITPTEETSVDQQDWLKQSDEPATVQPSSDFDFLDQTQEAESQTEQPEISTTPTPSMADVNNLGVSEQERDDSFAWLESLAAKQGATEGLLTKPEDRLEEEPDWVRQAKGLQGLNADRVPAEESSTVMASEPSLSSDLVEPELQSIESTQVASELPAMEELAPTEPPVPQPSFSLDELGKSEQERDDSFAWLESLAAKQGASEGLLTKPEERLEQEPDWVKQAKDVSATTPAEQTSVETPSMEEVLPVVEPPSMPESVVNVEELGKSEQERDDSFAWLESLAAKQGASEGLLTKPEERREEEPDWVKQAKDLSVTPSVQADAQEESVQEPAPSMESPAMDDTNTWLRSLDEEETTTSPEPSRASDETGMWLKSLTEEESTPEPTSTRATDETGMWLRSLSEEESKLTPSSTPTGDETAMWLKSLSEEELKPASTESEDDETAMWLKSLDEAEKVAAETEPEISEHPDLPAWMQNIDQGVSPDVETPISSGEVNDTSSWLSSTEEPAPPSFVSAEDSPKPETGSLPSWLRGLEKTESPTPTASPQDELPAWLRDETGEFVAEPTKIEPTRATDWQPAEKVEPSTPEPMMNWQEPVEEKEPDVSLEQPIVESVAPEPEPVEMVEEQPSPVEQVEPTPEPAPAPPPQPYSEPVTRKGTGMLSMPAVDSVLGSARSELSRSNIPGALDSYARLIKKGRYLDEIIHDLRDALYRYPVEVSIWQSLGDAYMRANRLQDALDAYTKAEELLR
ncbi:MAG TPA: tetratricopeptide repeat protein [Anaerolineales bacterium]|nr:tetratricopeptide repeat protein [Anaerolineales bacterium]